MCKSRFFLCCMVALLGFGPSAFGQPPDKQTPAAESACNLLKADEFTKGLYGLCVAFCKAKGHVGESSQSLDRILANYERRRTGTDPECRASVLSLPSLPLPLSRRVPVGPMQRPARLTGCCRTAQPLRDGLRRRAVQQCAIQPRRISISVSTCFGRRNTRIYTPLNSQRFTVVNINNRLPRVAFGGYSKSRRAL